MINPQPVGAWIESAACRGMHQLFDPPIYETPARREAREHQAKAICAECPVTRECAEHGETEPANGMIYGGQVRTPIGEPDRLGTKETRQARNAEILRLARQGHPDHHLARTFNLSYDTVTKLITRTPGAREQQRATRQQHRNTLREEIWRRRNLGQPYEQIADALGISRSFAHRIATEDTP